MSPQEKAMRRTIVGSFAAGVSAVVFFGLIAPVALQSGLTVRDAFASTLEQSQPVIQPLDVEAIEARLAEADRAMEAMRASTDDEMAMLERLSR